MLFRSKNAIALKSSAAKGAAKNVAQSILQALDHPERASILSAEARQMVERKYSWDRTVLDMETLYGTGENSGLASD